MLVDPWPDAVVTGIIKQNDKMNFHSNQCYIWPILLQLLLLVFLVHCAVTDKSSEKKPPPRIAVIGAGIGGTATGHFLRQLFGRGVYVDLYEAGEVGGRLGTVTIRGKEYNSGGTLIHPRNMYMVNMTELLGLKSLKTQSGHIALHDGKDVLFDGSEYSWILAAQMFWRYGWDVVRLDNFITDMLGKFDRIYKHQEAGIGFTTPVKLLESMSPEFVTYLHISMEEALQKAGMSSKTIEELGMAVQRNNYGQTTSTQAFVGAVSVAGFQPGLWRVQGGNKQVPIKLIENSKVNLVKSKVTRVELSEKNPPKYKVVTDDSSKTYDIVIVATPLHDKLSGITFENFPKKKISDFPQHFHRTVATFVQGQPNFPKFGYTTFHNFPENLLTVKDDIFFNSIGKQTPVKSPKPSYKDKQELPTWKVFSQKPLSEQEINQLFLSYENKKIVDWMAYPAYTSDQEDPPPFVLHDNLYYLNAIELCASAMEMSAIGAKNVALLAYNNWNGRLDRIDPDLGKGTNVKSEL